MRLTQLFSLLLCALSASSVSATTPTPTKRAGDGFVTVKGSSFDLNGEEFAFLGTNVYWLATVVTDDDIKKTLKDIKDRGVKVIRTWGFNDVTEIPDDGSIWFQLIKDGELTLNEGEDGLQRLDKIVKFSEEIGLHVLISLTNNWNPVEGEEPHKGKDGLRKRHNDKRPRNSLSNDYGGIDAYVREFGCNGHHDEFFTNSTILEKFKSYTTQIVKRYKDSKAVFAWEIANDARCASSLLASKECNTLTVTDWHDEIAKHVKSVDENHIVSSGVHGFLCPDCPKRFPPPPPPVTSPAPKPKGDKRKRAPAPKPKPITKENLMREFNELRKAKREQRKREGKLGRGMSIRGRWVAELEARQTDTSLGSAFDGTFGVDSEDITNSPNIDVSSFQLFPDDNSYGPSDLYEDDFDQALEIGQQWIKIQGRVGSLAGKPSLLGGFGIVTDENLPFFVPVNSTEPATQTGLRRRQSIGISSDQQQSVFAAWVGAGSTFGLGGVSHWQWGQPGLTVGNTVTPNTAGSTTTPGGGASSGVSPNDGFRSQPTAPDAGSRFA